jgi:hypothetical protein
MKLRFSLRTLLVLVTICAVASWVYWIGWPWWRDHRQQSRFVDAARQLKVGMMAGESEHLRDFESKFAAGVRLDIDQNIEGGLICHYWPDTAYCFYWVQAKQDFHGWPLNPPMQRIELYRLPPVPRGYRSTWLPATNPTLDYEFDFLRFLNGDRNNNPGFKYELIYADPPAEPGAGLKESKPADEGASQ